MLSPIRTLRYLRSWLTGGGRVRIQSLTMERSDGPIGATWLTPSGASPPRGTWIVLHGLTRSGRHHPSLRRFTRALAATGAGVLIPDVPEWQALRLAPHATEPTVRAALSWLEEQPGMEGGRRGLIGFSFGAPQAIALSAEPELHAALSGVVAFGGYVDLERTVRFQLTGEHGWEGRHHRHPPDPYGRWIVAGNHLTGVPGHEDHGDVAEALLELARRAGDARVPSRGEFMETVKREVRPSVDPDRREVFDFLAPPGGGDPRGEEADLLASRLAEAAVASSPGLDVRPRLPDVRGPVHLVHGRNDHLIPFTEAWRMADELPPAALAQVTVTALFGHSAEDRFPWGRAVPEVAGFAGAMARLLGVV